jgi:hypothetical protein
MMGIYIPQLPYSQEFVTMRITTQCRWLRPHFMFVSKVRPGVTAEVSLGE